MNPIPTLINDIELLILNHLETHHLEILVVCERVCQTWKTHLTPKIKAAKDYVNNNYSKEIIYIFGYVNILKCLNIGKYSIEKLNSKDDKNLSEPICQGEYKDGKRFILINYKTKINACSYLFNRIILFQADSTNIALTDWSLFDHQTGKGIMTDFIQKNFLKFLQALVAERSLISNNPRWCSDLGWTLATENKVKENLES